MDKDKQIEELQAQVAKLKLQNQKLSQSTPDYHTRTSVKQLFSNEIEYVGKQVGLGGWVRTCRLGGGGSFAFVKIYDGTCAGELQVFVESSCPGFEFVSKSCTGAALFCNGEIVASKGREQNVELKATRVFMVGPCDPDTYPLAGKNLTLEFYRTNAHLRARGIILGAVARVRSALAFATHKFYRDLGYQYVHTPLITASDCEGGGEMFAVTTLLDDHGNLTERLPNGQPDFTKDFFKKPAFLTVSGQLNVETYCAGLSNVYTFGPTFRAENSHTSRHLAEFWMIEPEIAFADLRENMDVAERYIKFLIQFVLDEHDADLVLLEGFEVRNGEQRRKEAAAKAKAESKRKQEEQRKQRALEKELAEKAKAEGKEVPAPANNKKSKKKGKKGKGKKGEWRDTPLRERLQHVIRAPFARISYTEAIDILLKAQEEGQEFVESNIEWGMDMASEHERFICETHFQKPTIVYNYPKDIKAFYMRMNEDGKTVAAMDILVPGLGELVGGSQREERLDVLQERMKELDLQESDYKWYMDLRRYGSVPHSGFGLGFGRMVCYTTGMDNIRDIIPFPRYPGHAEF